MNATKFDEDDLFSKGKKRNHKKDGKKTKELRDRYSKIQKYKQEDNKALEQIDKYWKGKEDIE